jgi:hypothetical protein
MDICQSCLDEKKDKPELEIIELPCLHFVCLNCIRQLNSERSTCLAGQTNCRGFLLVRNGETKETALSRLEQEYQAAIEHLPAICAATEEKIQKRLVSLTKKHQRKIKDKKWKHYKYRQNVIEEIRNGLPGCGAFEYADLIKHYRDPEKPNGSYVIDPRCKVEYAIDQTTAYVWRKCEQQGRDIVRTWSLETKGPWIGPHKAAPREERPEFVASPLFTIPANSWVKIRNKSIEKQIDWKCESLKQPYDPSQDLALIKTQHAKYTEKKRAKLEEEQEKIYSLIKNIEADIETLKARIETGEAINPIVVHKISLRVANTKEIREVKRLFRAPRPYFNGIPRTKKDLVFCLAKEESLIVFKDVSFVCCGGRQILLLSERATSSTIIFGVLWVYGPTQTCGYDLDKHCIYTGNIPLVTFSLERPLGSFVLVDPARKVWHLTISPAGAALPYAVEERN